MNKIVYFIFGLAMISCGQPEGRLERALCLAGENRPELERVLHHYSRVSDDSLKLKAAKFLIENMPGHYTLESPEVDECRKRMDADTTASYFARKALDICLSDMGASLREVRRLEDVQHVRSDFLIRHIDRSFENLDMYPWLEDVPFDLFLEYILPYRFTHERLDLWIDSLHVSPKTLNDLNQKDNLKYRISRLENELKFAEATNAFTYEFIKDLFGYDIYDDCRNLSYLENFRSRALGLPAAIDVIALYASRNGYHYWNKIISPETKSPEIRQTEERRTAKVYRRTYSNHSSLSDEVTGFVPDFFKDPFHVDISLEYLHTADLSVRVTRDLKRLPRQAYLCVFNNLEWRPLAMGNLSPSLAEFENMGKNFVYLPVCYVGKKLTPLNYPFIFNLKGEVRHLVPDTVRRQKVVLTRKYPSNGNLFNYKMSLAPIVIEASNQPTFLNPDTVFYSLDAVSTYCVGITDTDKKYRYWRVSNNRFFVLAELYFYDKNHARLQGVVDSIYRAAFDEDPLTCTDCEVHKTITIDFSQPVNVSKVVCLPRSDGNGIYPENEYELFYYDLFGWKSLGRKKTMSFELEYDNLPQGTLYWLRNRTTGVEERIFTIENGIQRFW